MTTPAERYDALVQWVQASGGRLHPAVEIAHLDDTKASFRAVDSIKNGDDIVALPLSNTLSYLNAISGHPEYESFSHSSFKAPVNTPFFPKDFLKATPPHVIGRFVLMQQYLLGNESSWWPYIRSLPQPEHMGGMLPALWPEDDIEFLQGTNAYVAVLEIKSTLKKEFKDAIKLLPESFQLTYTRPLYFWSYAIFTSRSFRPSLVIPDSDSMSIPCAIDDFSVLLPLYDIGNHSPVAKASWTADREAQTVSLRICETYEKGQQVFNVSRLQLATSPAALVAEDKVTLRVPHSTIVSGECLYSLNQNYGMKTNAELLLGYGFVLPERDGFHNDYVHIKTKPADDDDFSSTHIVSLRPISDRSSVVGRSRRLTSSDDIEVVTEFTHIQDSLVASLYEAIIRSSGVDEVDEVSMDDLMAGNFPKPIRDKIIQALGSKLSYDLDELEEIEVPTENLNVNQQLAVLYRDQCRQVFENALRSLANAMDSE